jgi:hypothetical protein
MQKVVIFAIRRNGERRYLKVTHQGKQVTVVAPGINATPFTEFDGKNHLAFINSVAQKLSMQYRYKYERIGLLDATTRKVLFETDMSVTYKDLPLDVAVYVTAGTGKVKMYLRTCNRSLYYALTSEKAKHFKCHNDVDSFEKLLSEVSPKINPNKVDNDTVIGIVNAYTLAELYSRKL